MINLVSDASYFQKTLGKAGQSSGKTSCKCTRSGLQYRLMASRAPQEECLSVCPHVLHDIHIFVTYCGYRKGQGGKKEVSEGSYKRNAFFSFNSLQHIFQASDPIENDLQELNSLQQMRAFSFALINTFFTDIKLHPSGSRVDWRRRGLLAVLLESQFKGWSCRSLVPGLAH